MYVFLKPQVEFHPYKGGSNDTKFGTIPPPAWTVFTLDLNLKVVYKELYLNIVRHSNGKSPKIVLTRYKEHVKIIACIETTSKI